jgi:hypothetical protein
MVKSQSSRKNQSKLNCFSHKYSSFNFATPRRLSIP